MGMLNTGSLAGTLDTVNRSLFYSEAIAPSERKEIARWIASLQGKPGSYYGMFAPTEDDFRNGVKMFTGETVRSKAGTSHILGEEACRTLILLDVDDITVRNALQQATAGMLEQLNRYESGGNVSGLYCCGNCSVAYWRHIAAGGLDRNEARLAAGMAVLKSYRTGDGRWRRFPFAYTLLALGEINLLAALEEMRYAAPVLERYLKKTSLKSEYSQRKRIIYERILAKC